MCHAVIVALLLLGPIAAQAADNDGIALLNQIRTRSGLQPLLENEALARSAGLHAAYIAPRKRIDHLETGNTDGFFAATPSERCDKAGYSPFCSEVITAGIPDGDDAMRDLLRAPFHRKLLLDPQGIRYGASAAMGQPGARVIDIGIDSEQQGVIGWPNESIPVSPLMPAGHEVPDPVPLGVKAVGYPVSLQAGASIDVTTFVVVEAGSNTPLPAQLLVRDALPYAPDNFVLLVPNAPLKPGTHYTVRFTGQIDHQPTTLSWSFDTLAHLDVKASIDHGELKLTAHTFSGDAAYVYEGFDKLQIAHNTVRAKKTEKNPYIRVSDPVTGEEQRIDFKD
ncbi:CAP domain-containing protein [Andreprevotia chitinilytica]|uniref:CAP domain-containing protein n=1 Tax=Andreprevotia chitinilytica TaxID=396808 RepID=UPI0005538250|nr:CAP domain-containing protein [Andreprevotia chitinilytica]